MLGVGKSGLHDWMHGNHIPSFPQLVNIAFTCNCSIAHVLQGNQHALYKSGHTKPDIVPHSPSRRKAPRKLNIKSLGEKLQVIATEEPPIWVVQAAAKLGVDKAILYRYFGKIAREMTRRVLAQIQHERKIRLESKYNLYRQSAEKLVQQGKRPTSSLVSLDLKGIETVRLGEQRKACARICREVIDSFHSPKSEAANI